MKTYPIKDETDRVYAFEIENAYIGLRALVHILCGVPGVSDVRSRVPFERSGDVRGTFRFAGANFVIVEPFGDNSRYWIGPADDRTAPSLDITPIEASLRSYRPPMLRKVVGDLITLNIRSLLGG